MSRCNECRPLILDHLYGLLEAPEAAVVEAHLAECPECAAARTEAARIQGLFGEAAKSSFPAVRFEPPAAKPRTPTVQTPAPQSQSRGPAAVPFPQAAHGARAEPAGNRRAPGGRGTSRIAGFFPWAIAAAVLLAVPGTVYPVLNVLSRAEAARRDADSASAKAANSLREYAVADRDANQALLAAHVRAREAQQTHDRLLAKWVSEEKAALQSQATRKLTWDLFKPAATQPGAPNEFMLVVRDTNTTPGGRIKAEFRDQTDAVIYSQEIKHEGRIEHPIRLPASVWARLTPQSELYFVLTREDEKTQEKTVLQEKVKLLGPVFATMLTTDKPTYRPGETVHFRSLTLDRVTFTPPAREQFLHFELRGPNGAPVRVGKGKPLDTLAGVTSLVRVVEGLVAPVNGPDGHPLRGIGTGEFELPADAPDGDYTLVMEERRHPSGQMPVVPYPVTRTFKVRSGAAEAYTKRIIPGAASYSAGDTVEATAELKFLGAPVAGARVQAVAEADGQKLNITEVQPLTDAEGKAKLRFALPDTLKQGDVRLKVTFDAPQGQKSVEETVADRVPVVGRNIIVEFFPEGGDPVAGVPCRVYFRVTTPTGQPVDLSGTITDGQRVLAKVSTVTDASEAGANRGIGSFTFTPEIDTPVWLQLDTPTTFYSPLLPPADGEFPAAPAAAAGVSAVTSSRTGFVLPKPKIEGVVMSVPDPVTSPGQPIRVQLWSVGQQTRNLVVGAYTRGRLSDTQHITVENRRLAEVRLMANTDPRGGVVRITVFEEPENPAGEAKADLIPMAERLVFRRPGESLNLSFEAGYLQTGLLAGREGRSADLSQGAQRGLGLNITATDEKGNPAAAILYAAAVNSAVAAGPKDRLLTTHFLLAGEISTPDAMEYADFLLTEHPKAPRALDLVLGTQGWRRFAEQVQPGFAKRLAAAPDWSDPIVCNGQYMTATEPLVFREERRLHDSYWPRYEEAVKTLDAAKAAARVADEDHSAEQRARELAKAAQVARAEADAVTERAAQAEGPVKRFLGAGWYAVGGFGLLAAMLAVAGFARTSARLPFGIGTVGSVGIVAFLVIALGMAERTQAAAEKSVAVASLDRTAPVVVLDDGVHDTAPAPRAAGTGLVPELGAVLLKGADTAPGRAKGAAKDTFALGPFGGVKGGFGSGALGGIGGGFPSGGAGGGYGGGGPGGYGGPPPAGVMPVAPTAPSEARPEPKKMSKSDFSPPRPDPKGIPAPPGPLTMPPLVLPAGPPVGGGAVPPVPGVAGAPPRGGPGGRDSKPEGWQPNAGKGASSIPDSLLPDRDRAHASAARFGPNGTTVPAIQSAGSGLAALTGDAGTVAKARAESHLYFLKDYETAQKQIAERNRALHVRMTTSLDRISQQFREVEAVVPQAQGGGRPGIARLSPDAVALRRVQLAVPNVGPLVVREYAAPRPGTLAEDVHVPADTILWQPVIVLPSDGKTTLELNLGAAPGYQVIVAGHTLDGRIGAVRRIIPAAGSGGPAFAPSNSTPAQVAPPKP